MAELVDALVSGTSIRKDVQVRVLFRALLTRADASLLFLFHKEQDEKFIPTIVVGKSCSGHF